MTTRSIYLLIDVFGYYFHPRAPPPPSPPGSLNPTLLLPLSLPALNLIPISLYATLRMILSIYVPPPLCPSALPSTPFSQPSPLDDETIAIPFAYLDIQTQRNLPPLAPYTSDGEYDQRVLRSR